LIPFHRVSLVFTLAPFPHSRWQVAMTAVYFNPENKHSHPASTERKRGFINRRPFKSEHHNQNSDHTLGTRRPERHIVVLVFALSPFLVGLPFTQEFDNPRHPQVYPRTTPNTCLLPPCASWYMLSRTREFPNPPRPVRLPMRI